MKNFLSIAVLAAILPLAAGCAAAGKTAAPRNGELAGTYWRPVNPMYYTYIEFTDDGRMIGNTGRNHFFGPVAYAKGKRIRLGPLATTRSRLTQAEKLYEEQFISRLEAARGYVLDGDTLTFYNEERQPLIRLIRLKPQVKDP